MLEMESDFRRMKDATGFIVGEDMWVIAELWNERQCC